MRKNLTMVGVLTLLFVVATFGGVMVGYTYNAVGYGAISIGTELSTDTFVYAGISFPLGLVAGGGMKMGTIFTTNLGKTAEGKNIGDLRISWGAVANAGVNFGYYTSFGVFGGPGIFFDWNSDFIEGNILWYTAVGLEFNSYSVLSYNSSNLSLGWNTGVFYKF